MWSSTMCGRMLLPAIAAVKGALIKIVDARGLMISNATKER